MSVTLPIKHKPQRSCGHVSTVYAILDLDAGLLVQINGKCGWVTQGSARNALSHLIGADHDRERFYVGPVVPETDAPQDR